MTPKKPYRQKRLFPRSLDQAMQDAMKPMMNNQGKLYSALLRDWSKIVGNDRAKLCKPQHLQFASSQSQEATLHLDVRPAAAPEFAYITEQLMEQCARYFGYRAITRIVLHQKHGGWAEQEEPSTPLPAPMPIPQPVTFMANVPQEMQQVLSRIANHIGSSIVKKDETR